MKYNVVAPDGKVLNTKPVAKWCAQRLVSEYMREFGWTVTIAEHKEKVMQ